jgi:1-acyl-sn-glycerol-3-phosphate acyltransferase
MPAKNTDLPLSRPAPRWAVVVWYWLMTRLMAFALWAFGQWEVTGREHVPASGGLLVISNHLNNSDPPLLGASIRKRRIRFMAKAELFHKRPWNWAIWLFGAFPVRREEADLRALRTATELLKGGAIVAILPEGHRNRHGTGMQKAQPGAALVALRAGVPILPVGITGSQQIRGLPVLLKHPRITVTIGEPFTLPKPERIRGDAVHEAMEIMMRRIAALLPPDYQGQWQPEPVGSAGTATADGSS